MYHATTRSSADAVIVQHESQLTQCFYSRRCAKLSIFSINRQTLKLADTLSVIGVAIRATPRRCRPKYIPPRNRHRRVVRDGEKISEIAQTVPEISRLKRNTSAPRISKTGSGNGHTTPSSGTAPLGPQLASVGGRRKRSRPMPRRSRPKYTKVQLSTFHIYVK